VTRSSKWNVDSRKLNWNIKKLSNVSNFFFNFNSILRFMKVIERSLAGLAGDDVKILLDKKIFPNEEGISPHSEEF
jgi:hypothetical protein